MNYINLIRRMDKLQKADDHLRRMDPDGESVKSRPQCVCSA